MPLARNLAVGVIWRLAGFPYHEPLRCRARVDVDRLHNHRQFDGTFAIDLFVRSERVRHGPIEKAKHCRGDVLLTSKVVVRIQRCCRIRPIRQPCTAPIKSCTKKRGTIHHIILWERFPSYAIPRRRQVARDSSRFVG